MKKQDKFKIVKSFWKAHASSARLMYLKDWKIYMLNVMRNDAYKLDWDKLTEIEQFLIWQAHGKAMHLNHE